MQTLSPWPWPWLEFFLTIGIKGSHGKIEHVINNVISTILNITLLILCTNYIIINHRFVIIVGLNPIKIEFEDMMVE